MPSTLFMTGLSEEDSKNVLIEICRSPTSAQNLERIVRCLLPFWDSARCALVIDKDIVSEIFSSLKYGPDVIDNTEISSLSLLDVKAFLHLCVHCAYVRNERTKDKANTNARKFPIASSASEQLTTEWQRSWWRAAWLLCNGSGKQEDRIRLHEGLETLRLKSRDLPELPLLLSVAAMFETEVPDVNRYKDFDTKAVAASDYGKLYWMIIDKILEKDRILQPRADAMFYAGLTPLPRSRRDHYRSLAKYYYALNALLHGKEDEAVPILEQLETPQAFYALAQIYKNSAEKIVGRPGDEGVELRRRALLSKARDAFQSTMIKLNAHVGNGCINEAEIAKNLDELNASLATSIGSPSVAAAGDLSSISAVTPIASSTLSYSTPASRFVTPRNLSGNNSQASASLLLELGQSVDYALRALTQSQDTLVRGIMEQNRALTHTCDGMMAQMKELTLTNKALVEEMKEIRRENSEYRAALTTLESGRSRSQWLGDSYQSHVSTTPASVTVSARDGGDTKPKGGAGDIPVLPKQEIPKAVEPKPPSFASFKPKPGSWECKDCYTRNEPTSANCVCCGGAGPSGAVKSNQSSSSAFPPPPPPALSPTQSITAFPPPVFGLPTTTASKPAPVVSTTATTAASGGHVFGIFKPETGLNFGAVASQAKPATTSTPSSFQAFQGFKGAGTPVFGNLKTSTPERTRQESENDDSTDAPFEPTAEFKPLIPLPALVDTKSGEEDEEVLFKERAKLYRWGADVDGKEGFKERGVGDLKILKHRESRKVRILMRREQVLKICANHAICPGMQLLPMKNSDRAFTWHCQDYAEGEVTSEMLAVRFKEAEQAQKFKEIFEKEVASASPSAASNSQLVVDTSPPPPALSVSQPIVNRSQPPPPPPSTGQSNTAIVSAPVFGSSTTTSAPVTGSGLSTTTSSPSTGHVFGSLKPNSGLSFAAIASQTTPQNTSTPFQSFQGFKGFQGAGTPVFGSLKTSTPERTRQESENDDSTDTPFEPTAEFKPVIPLPDLVDTKSGEEDEEILFKERAKLFRWGTDVAGNEGFKERGVGDLKILKHRESGKVRILMRREQILKICANHALRPGMQLLPMKNSDRAFTWHCQDYADGEVTSELLAVRFKEAEQAQKFKEIFENVVASASPSPAKASQPTVNRSPPPLPPPAGQSNMSPFSPPTTTATPATSSNNSTMSSGGPSGGHVFGTFKPTSGLSFAALASQTLPQTTSTPFQSFQGFKGFQGAGTPVFGSLKTSTPERTRQESETDDSADTPFESTAEFKPLIPLPELVDTKSGEEEEEILFKERAKLYRWGTDVDGKEGFKDRGVGDLKILRHRETGKFRILMRREQVLKICANHTIRPGMQLLPMKNSDRAFTWHCQDYAEGEVKSEMLAVRFKDAEQAQKFKRVFEEALASSESGAASSSGAAAGDAKSTRKKESDGSSDDISVVYEAKADQRQESMADRYQLPKTFYVEHAPCPGCIGCASDEVQDKIMQRPVDKKEGLATQKEE